MFSGTRGFEGGSNLHNDNYFEFHIHEYANDVQENGYNVDLGVPDIDIHKPLYDSSVKNDPIEVPKKLKRSGERTSDSEYNISTELLSLPQIDPPIKLTIEGIPRKSRVETQIKMTLKFSYPNGKPLNKYKTIILSEDQIAPNIRKKKNRMGEIDIMKRRKEPHLYLKCKVVGSQNSDSEIFRCINCIQRERKNYCKKLKQVNSNLNQMEQEFTEILSNKELLAREKMRIIQFHTGQYVDIVNGEARLPLRITCYCRHHKEPNGFGIKLLISDGQTEQLLISTVTSHVLITDDHKSIQKAKKKRKLEEIESPSDSITMSPISPKSEPSSDYQSDVTEQLKFITVAERVIPKSGPLTGGIEVTILGKNFLPHQHCYFGPNKALACEFWTSESIVCIVPPSTLEGPVPVYLSHLDHATQPKINESAVFLYNDVADKRILEIALQLVGMRMTGQVQDPKMVALDIVQSNGYSNNQYMYPGVPTDNYKNCLELCMQNDKLDDIDVEEAVIKAIRYATAEEPSHLINISIQDISGHTLLHYAIQKGYSKLFAELIDFIYNPQTNILIDINICDKGGYTPLHFASLYAQHNMASELLYLGAWPILNNENGDIPIDLTQDELMIEILSEEFLIDYTASSMSSTEDGTSISGQEEDTVVPLQDDQLKNNHNDSEKQVEMDDDTSDEVFNFQYKVYNRWMWVYRVLSIIWANYRIPIYIGLLIVMGGLLIVEYVPFKLSSGIESSQGSILTDGHGNAPESSGNNPGGIKIFDFFANLPWWKIYFSARWFMVCAIFFGITSYMKSRMKKPVAYALQILNCVIFLIGLLYIFGAFG